MRGVALINMVLQRRLVRRRAPTEPRCHPSTHRIPPGSLFRLVDFRLSCRSVHMQLSRAGSHRGNRYRDHRKNEASIACRRVAAATLVTTVAILYRRPLMPPRPTLPDSVGNGKGQCRPTRCQMPDPDTLLPHPTTLLDPPLLAPGTEYCWTPFPCLWVQLSDRPRLRLTLVTARAP